MQIKIVIGKKEYPCRITLGAMLRFQRETGKDVQKMDGNNTIEMATFLWCCVVSACTADGIEFGMSLEEFADRIDSKNVTEFYQAIGSQKKKEEKAAN